MVITIVNIKRQLGTHIDKHGDIETLKTDCYEIRYITTHSGTGTPPVESQMWVHRPGDMSFKQAEELIKKKLSDAGVIEY